MLMTWLLYQYHPLFLKQIIERCEENASDILLFPKKRKLLCYNILFCIKPLVITYVLLLFNCIFDCLLALIIILLCLIFETTL